MLKSKSLPERVALIEFDSSHDECLLTQVNALKSHGCLILLITNDLVKSRNQHLVTLVDEWHKIDPRGVGLTGAAIGDAMIIRRLMRSLKKLKVEKVIFNTGQGGHVRNACLFSLFRKIEFIGIVHTIRKFQGSFTQNVINLKIKKYFVLAEFLKEKIPTGLRLRSARVGSFYPIDFPKADEIIVNENTIHISIIGSVETRRKDLEGFISLIEQCDAEVRFSFLGKADPTNNDVIELKEKLVEINCLDRVEFFQNRVGIDEIDRILRKTTAILPLIHPDTPSANEYFRHQIPGSMNIALGYKVPLLLHEHFHAIKELNPASCYYKMDQFSQAIDELISRHSSIQNTIKSTEAYSSSWNQKQYLGFLFS